VKLTTDWGFLDIWPTTDIFPWPTAAGRVLLNDPRYFHLHGTGVFYRQQVTRGAGQ
jgi:hypothetical protein